MKKEYIKPGTECQEMEVTQMMAFSNGDDVQLSNETTEEAWSREDKGSWDFEW